MSVFKNPSDIKVTHTIKALVYGEPGTGKSTVALSAPSPVLLDFDGGVQRVSGAFQCPTLQVENWQQVTKALEEINENEVRCETIVIDTAGKMLDYMSAEIIRTNSRYGKADGSLSLQGYGVRKTMFINFLRQVAIMGKHVVFVAHEREDKDGDVWKVRPDIGGSSASDLIKELDLVGYMCMIGKERTIGWTPQEKYYAKNTCNLPPIHKVNTIIDESGQVVGENNFLTLVFKGYESYLASSVEKRKKYDKLLASFEKGIEDVQDDETANSVYQKINTFNGHIWDSKLRAEQKLQEKANSLGLKFNSIDDKYEKVA